MLLGGDFILTRRGVDRTFGFTSVDTSGEATVYGMILPRVKLGLRGYVGVWGTTLSSLLLKSRAYVVAHLVPFLMRLVCFPGEVIMPPRKSKRPSSK
ncbi:hypothetical protein GW17_00026199 [Ensete ventricosum]|nr:hypothetical protein GW17_00026199 [Ensete ventricosum]